MIGDIRTGRSILGISQVRLAQISGVSLPTIQNVESRKANPTIDVLEKLSAALGMELKMSSLPFNVDHAVALGVPLTPSESPPPFFPVNATSLKNESRRWHSALAQKSLNEREELALIGFLMAVKHHYPDFYHQELASPIVEKKINENLSSGKVIKLRRIALARICKYL